MSEADDLDLPDDLSGPETIELETLDLDKLPEGQVTAAWLPILENAMGDPIRLPLLIARGTRPGPSVGLTAAVHGEELNGIPAIHHLFAGLECDRLRGNVIAVVVANPLAFHRRSRRLEDAFDLNHLFPGRRNGHVGEVLAQRLRKRVLHHFDVLLDLHTASRGRVNSFYVRADMSELRTARMAYLQRPQIIVHNTPSDGTLRGAAASLGVPAITLEIGDPQRFQPRFWRRAVSGLRAVLADLEVIPRRAVAMGEEPVLCASSSWTFTDRGGLLEMAVGIGERVHKGALVARLLDVFGRERTTYHAPFEGVVIGHSVDPIAPTGSRIVHLGRLASEEEVGVLTRHQALDAVRGEDAWSSSSS